MIEGSLVHIHDHAASGTFYRGKFGIVLSSKLAWEADERDETLLVNVLTAGDEIEFYDWQLDVIDESR
jgi:hypothetical protein